MKDKVDYSLYLVTDRDILGDRDLCTAMEEAILGGVSIIQLREKNISSLDFYNSALKVKKVTDKYNIPLIINDRLDIALAIDAAGVHLGQSDLPCEIARKILGENKILGISTATLEEAVLAKKQGADYLGVGAMFSTSTKLNTRSVSISTLKEIKNTVNIPVVAIGGINHANYKKLIPTNIEGFAVVSAILGQDNIKLASQKFLDCPQSF
ncbi:thiamine phosphate synthase [Clostridium grantii]|uniref:Thiamine-phosphate synthase n=1 Tax=Clostridium grantii DSM 8605 TaxID=1121316 RepID=A0A1M5V3J9_9CLOT|nr:thiamine phosphate synthase [Clostridium grantii]SHH69847.1 thiamine-phosphate pyrophosphorylase [Clostridium grantii DSM 8605]